MCSDTGSGRRVAKLEAELVNGRLAHGMHPVLSMCAANAVVTKDPAGARKLDKSRATGRIDGMVALCMAMGAAAMAEVPVANPYQERGLLYV